MVDRPVKGAPAPADLPVGRVQVPGAAGLAAPLRSPLVREPRGEADLPGVADRLVRDLEAAREEPLSDVAEASLSRRRQRTASSTLSVGSWRSLNGRAGPLVEAPPAGLAAEPPGAERGAALAPRRRRGCTVWTSQQRPLTVPWMRRAEAGVP